MLIRVRSRDGLERVKCEDGRPTVGHLRAAIESQLQVPVSAQILSRDQGLLLSAAKSGLPAAAAAYPDMKDPSTSLSSLGVGHGSVIFLAYEGERFVAGPAGGPTPAGSFGKKMTMDDLIARQTRIERQEKPRCGRVSFDRDAANTFQHYVNETLAFASKRGGIMYGSVTEEGDVAVDFIYEPPQEGSEQTLMLLRDPEEEKQVDAIAIGLGLRKVGFIFSQTITQSKRDYTMSNIEIRQAAELHAESGFDGWVTALVKLEVNDEGSADVHFEPFQLSDQCVKLWKDGFIEENCPDLDPKLSRMKKDVVILGKDTRDVDNDFFLVPVKIFDHQVYFFVTLMDMQIFGFSSKWWLAIVLHVYILRGGHANLRIFVQVVAICCASCLYLKRGLLSSSFPVENRVILPTLRALKIHLDKTRNLPFVKRLSDFHLLLLLAKFLDLNTDVPQLAEAVRVQGSIPEGYQIIIESLATSI